VRRIEIGLIGHWAYKLIRDDGTLSHRELLHALLYRYGIFGRLLNSISLAKMPKLSPSTHPLRGLPMF
jgi:hypothetical protein